MHEQVSAFMSKLYVIMEFALQIVKYNSTSTNISTKLINLYKDRYWRLEISSHVRKKLNCNDRRYKSSKIRNQFRESSKILIAKLTIIDVDNNQVANLTQN